MLQICFEKITMSRVATGAEVFEHLYLHPGELNNSRTVDNISCFFFIFKLLRFNNLDFNLQLTLK